MNNVINSGEKKRLDYIDFMKGLCILLIVQFHIDCDFYDKLLPGLNSTLQSFRVPMYYFLSGLFFKLYDGMSDFTRRKVNNMIIPLMFFELVALLLALLKQTLGMQSTVGFEWIYFLDPVLIRKWHYTSPLWFLLSLFEVNIIYYWLQKYLKPAFQLLIVAALAITGFYLAQLKIELPMHLDTAFIGLPYFILGSYIKKCNMLQPTRYDKWGLWAIIPVLIVIYFVSGNENGKIDIHLQELPNLIQLYVIPAIAILTLFFACKNMRYVPRSIKFFGRYSIIVLGTHMLITPTMRAVFAKRMGETVTAGFTALVVTMIIEAVIIVICVKIFPRVTAQKEFFTHGWRLFLLKETSTNYQDI